MSALIDEACRTGTRLERTCKVAGISPRTPQRWRETDAIREDGALRRDVNAPRRTA